MLCAIQVAQGQDDSAAEDLSQRDDDASDGASQSDSQSESEGSEEDFEEDEIDDLLSTDAQAVDDSD